MDLCRVGSLLRHLDARKLILALCYHRIGAPEENIADQEVVSATQDAFERQVRWLKRHCEIIGPGDLEAALAQKNGRFALLTFDDGYRDNYQLAYPVLRQLSAGATFFVATGYVDNPRLSWWDQIAWLVREATAKRLQACEFWAGGIALRGGNVPKTTQHLLQLYKALPGEKTEAFINELSNQCRAAVVPPSMARDLWMTWPMLREMKAGGMWIGGHTDTHPVMARLNEQEQRVQIQRCATRLREELDQPMEWFSYPCGLRNTFDQHTRQCLSDAGVRWAFSYYGGYCRNGSVDPLDVPRVSVEMETDLTMLRAMCALPRVFCRTMPEGA